MKKIKIFNEIDQYLGFNLFAIGGWLYLPVLIYMLTFQHSYNYIWLPLGIFLLIPWSVSIFAFIIFIIEKIVSPKAKYKIFQNKIFKIITNTGLIFIVFFHIFLLKFLINL